MQTHHLFDAFDRSDFFNQVFQRGGIAQHDGNIALKKAVDRIYIDRAEGCAAFFGYE